MALWGSLFLKLEADRRVLEDAALKDTYLFSRAYAKNLVRSIEQLDQITLQIKVDWERSNGALRLDDAKRKGLFAAKQFAVVMIFDRNGLPVTSTIPINKAISVADRDYFKFHKNNNSDALRIGTPAIGRFIKKKVLFITRRLEKGDEFDGVVVMSVEPDFFALIADTAPIGATGMLAFVGGDGAVRVTTTGFAANQKTAVTLESIPIFGMEEQAILLAGDHWFSDRKPRYVASTALGSYPFSAVVALGQDEILLPYRQNRATYRQAAIGGSLVLLLFAAVAAMMSVRLARKREEEFDIHATYRIATEGANEGFYMLRALHDTSGNVTDFQLVDCNEYGAELYGKKKEELAGVKISEVGEMPRAGALIEIFQQVMQAGFHEDEFKVPNDSVIKAAWLHRRFVRSGSGLAVTLRDISEKKNHEHEMARLATEDALTGLPNRHWLMTYLPGAITRAAADKKLVAVLFIDLDDFKNVNDSSGHLVGDELLQAVAARIRSVLRPTDNIARLGGDEFTVILESMSRPEEAGDVACRISQALHEPFVILDRANQIGASIGISVFPRDGNNVEILLKSADIAMYAAKGEGKGQYRFFEPQLFEHVKTRLDMEQALVRATREDQFVMVYQPRVEAFSGKLVGMEALLRWEHPECGMVPPGEFIPLAERSGIIVGIGELVIDKVCAQIAVWKMQGIPAVPVSVNISARQFNEGKVAELISTCLTKFHLPAELIEIELTESAMMGDSDVVRNELASLAAIGVKIHVDDFGTGYSSLALLHQLDADVLKIDRAFTAQLAKGGKGEVFFEAMVSMAKALRMRVIAEGVETEEQLFALQSLACDEVQGYLISRPLAAHQIRDVLLNPVFLPSIFSADRASAESGGHAYATSL